MAGFEYASRTESSQPEGVALLIHYATIFFPGLLSDICSSVSVNFDTRGVLLPNARKQCVFRSSNTGNHWFDQQIVPNRHGFGRRYRLPEIRTPSCRKTSMLILAEFDSAPCFPGRRRKDGTSAVEWIHDEGSSATVSFSRRVPAVCSSIVSHTRCFADPA